MIDRTFPARKLARASVLGSACLVLLVACNVGTEPRDDVPSLPNIGEAKLQLERAANCDDLLTRIQDSILVQLSLRAEELKSGEGGYVTAPGIGVGVDNGGVAAEDPSVAAPRPSGGASEGSGGSGGTSAGAPVAPPMGNSNGDAPPQSPTPGAAGAGSVGGGFSGTTVQVKDVDEADIVKTDGDRIYLLHGGTLFVLQGWPANSTEVLGQSLIEGTPAEMFVKDGKAVVFSRVYADLDGSAAVQDPYGYYGYSSYTKLSVLDVSESEPRVLSESFVEGDYNAARRHGDVVRAVVQDGFKVPQLGNPNIEYRDGFGQPYPQVDIDAQVDAWLERTARSIRATDLGDWLPREFSKQNGNLVAVAPRCADYYSPDPGLTQTGVTSVVSLDLADASAALGGATILGNAERVYSNEDVVLITQTDYRYNYDAAATQQTIIHRFDISGSGTTYTASGAVAGSIHDQFSLDERDGVIRVSTTEQAWSWGGVPMPGVAIDVAQPAPPPQTAPAIDEQEVSTMPGAGGATSAGAAPDLPPSEPDATSPAPTPEPEPMPLPAPPVQPERPSSVSRVITLGTDGNVLQVLGETEDFGAGEQIFSTRFIGDRGYVVTFRQTDPLFVIDLADPADPHLVGELHIPGFSNYLFPLDDGHLFSIGRDATEQGIVQGLALQIFDVTDPATPTLAHRYVFPEQGDSPANVDHRAISFHPDRGIVAFPHQSYQTGESTLEVFQLSSETGFARLGGMGMTDEADLDSCIGKYFGYAPGAELDQLRAQVAADPAWQRDILASCRYGHVFRRALFNGDFVYGISNTGVYVYDFTALDAGAVGQVSLPAEVYDNVGYYGGGASPGIATPPSMGSAGTGGSIDLPIAPTPPEAPASGGAGGASSSGSAGDSSSDAAE